MKRVYHICLSGNNEIIFRDNDDYIYGINCLCLATHKTNASLLAYAFMSNHVHIGVRCEEPKKLMQIFRYAYARYFNNKYGRAGRLGEKNFYQIEIEGTYHFLTAIAYILRNPLHHGIAATPFGYKYSSINSLFQKELGRDSNLIIMHARFQHIYLPENNKLPPNYIMNSEGLMIPESVIDITDVQHQFSNARTFLYYMNRLSGESWEKEQLQDKTDLPPITLESIERSNFGQSLQTMLNNEHGKANYNAISDIELCYEIDKVILPKLNVSSVYKLSPANYNKVVKALQKKYHISKEQLNRCLPVLK